MFNFFKNKQKIAGEIVYLHLEDWWNNELTSSEKASIENIYKPFGSPEDYSLIKGNITRSNQTPLSFLSTLATWFDNSQDRLLAEKILNKANEYSQKSNVLDLHFYYANQMKLNYKRRNQGVEYLDKAIEFCKKQIEISEAAAHAFLKEYPDSSLPFHEGYHQFCIILEKQGEYKEARKIAQQAKKQGWNGEWEKRIINCIKKLKKEQYDTN